MVVHDITDLSLAARGAAGIEWSGRSMPVLRQIRERFAAEKPFDGVRIAACSHVTTETANLVLALRAGGAEVSLCASNPLSTQDDTAAALVVEHGIGVFARHGVDAATYLGHIDSVLDIKPTLLLDDCCDLINALQTRRPDAAGAVVAGCEATTTGVLRLRALTDAGALQFPMVAVNNTDVKNLFDNKFGTGQSTLDALMRATNMLLAGRTVVVAGYGYCGKGVASRARGVGAHVVVTEIDPIKALDAVMDGFTVLPMAQVARVGDVFVAVTGNRDVITGEHLSVMKDGAILANSGHFDIEIDVAWLADNAESRRVGVRPHVDEYTMDDGRRLLLLADGRLSNLAVAEGHPAAVMDMSFAIQALTAEWLVGHHGQIGVGVVDVPHEIDREVARLKLAALDIEIDVLNKVQSDYLISWEQIS